MGSGNGRCSAERQAAGGWQASEAHWAGSCGRTSQVIAGSECSYATSDSRTTSGLPHPTSRFEVRAGMGAEPLRP